MFGNEVEYKIPLGNTMRVALINYNISNIEIATKIQEKILITNKNRFQINQVENLNDLFKYKEVNKEETNKGLINIKWINNFNNFIPSVIIVYYYIKPGSNKENEEKNICLKIEEIRNHTKSCFLFIIIIYKDMLENQNKLYFNFDDKQKPYYLRTYLTKDCLYILPEEQIWKLNEFGEICNKILYYSRQYYKIHKKAFQEKRSQSKSREDKIEYDIKLAVISSIKSKKANILESKYLEEAYEILCDKNYDLNTYKYGNKPTVIKNNFYEIRAAADWLFFKSNNNFQKSKRTSSKSLPNSKLGKNNTINVRSNSTFRINIHEQIKKSERHIYTFRNNKYYDNGQKDYFHFVEYYWLVQRYIILTNSIEENISKTKVDMRVLLKFGMMLFKEVYNLIRLIKFYNDYFNDKNYNLLSININDKTIDIKDIKVEDNIYFGKPPIYYIINKEKAEQKEIIGYNDEIYIKKFILNNKINLDDLIDKFKNKYWHHLSSFFIILKDKFLKNNNSESMKGINMYIYLLKIIGLTNNLNSDKMYEINDINEFYSKIIYNFNRIKKFPKIYMHFIKQYINFIKYKIQKEENAQNDKYKTELFINLSLLGNLRKLDSDEENLFYQLLNDTQFIPINKDKDKEKDKEKDKDKENDIIINLNYYNKNNMSIINCNDLAFNFDYSIKNIEKYQERTLLDLIEYEIKFNSTLSQDKIKFNSLKLFFEYSYENKIIDKNIVKKDKKKENIKDPKKDKIINKISKMIIKEFNKEELDKYELGLNSNINISHKLLIKYKKGKILLNKIIFSLCKKENIFYSINLPNEFNKAIFIIDKEKDVLKIKYPKKTLIAGIYQLFKFEYIINKEQINNIKITDYKHSFQAEKINKNNSMSQIESINTNIKTNKKNNNNTALNLINKKSEDKSDTLRNFIFNDPERHVSFESSEISHIPPSFYVYDKTKQCMEESKKDFEYIYNNFESRLEEGKNKYDILIKFYNYGLYTIKLNIKYFIVHEEVDAKLEFNHEEIFYFKVVDPLPLSHKINSNNYLLYNNIKSNTKKSKEYLTDTDINMNLIFKNLLDEDILIKDIIITLNQNKDIETNCTVKDIIDSKDIEDSIKEQILCILKSTNYIIPYDLKFFSSFNGSLGKIKIIWTTKSLIDFENNKNIKNINNFNFKNENEYELPNIDINRIKLKFDYEYTIQNDNEIIINALITNNALFNKKLTVKIENNDDNSYIISGLTKYFINLKFGEKKNIYIKLIVLQKGEIKLPDIIIKERDYSGRKISCNYFCPEKIILN